MVLHQINRPKSAHNLFRIVKLQGKLLRELSDPTLDTNLVNTDWIKGVWNNMDAEWVRKFCLGGQEARVKAIAHAPLLARQALYTEFCKQNRARNLFRSGGNFQDFSSLPGFNDTLAKDVKEFFKHCYKKLSVKAPQWNGYEFPDGQVITNQSYKRDFCDTYPTVIEVCPYCDCGLGKPELDHYFPQSKFPLLACSPLNLVPVCGSCNDIITAKGDQAPLSLGSPNSTENWLHPFFRIASSKVKIKLTEKPQYSQPFLHSPDPDEQKYLDNHMNLIKTLSVRWRKSAFQYFDSLVQQVNLEINATKTIDSIVLTKLRDHNATRGKLSSSLIYAAVCQAVLDNRPGYREEFEDSNPVRLSSSD
jgi:hypothetical protein